MVWWNRSQMPFVCGLLVRVRVCSMFSRSRYSAYSCDSRLPQYSLPRSVRIRSSGTPCSSKEGQHAIVKHVRRGDCILTVVQLHERQLAVGVDERLLVDPSDAFEVADVIGILRSQIARMLRLNLTVRFLLLLRLLEGTNLVLGQDEALLRHLR